MNNIGQEKRSAAVTCHSRELVSIAGGEVGCSSIVANGASEKRFSCAAGSAAGAGASAHETLRTKRYDENNKQRPSYDIKTITKQFSKIPIHVL